MKRILSTLLFSAILLTACSGSQTVSDDTSASDTTEAVTTVEDRSGITDLDESVKFDGETFTVAIYENPNAHNHVTVEEQTGDTLDDAIYDREMKTEERLGIEFEELVVYDDIALIRNNIMAGDGSFDVATPRCTHALTLWQEGLLTEYDKLPYIDPTKDYWKPTLNDSLSIGEHQYTMIGDMLVSVLDFTFALTFNKQLIEDLSLENPYELVKGGEWTVDKMKTMMLAATRDLDGNTTFDGNDSYGYTAHPKNVLPNFWLAGGLMSVSKNAEDIPELGIGDEKFMNLFTSVFELTYDTGVYYKAKNLDNDVPTESINMFLENKALFLDATFFHLASLRNMDTDFGILPYPKQTAEQESYYSRVSYYNAPIIPVTNERLELTGAVLEYINYVASETTTPAYYDIAIRGKVTRDNESLEMLDIISNNLVVDIGDTTLCSTIRDGVMYDCFDKDDRNLASKIPSVEATVAEMISKLPV